MKIKDFLYEAKPKTSGTERLVSSIHNMAEWEKKPPRIMIKLYLLKLEKDKEFISRIKSKASSMPDGGKGYIFGAIRRRTISHFGGKLKPEFRAKYMKSS